MINSYRLSIDYTLNIFIMRSSKHLPTITHHHSSHSPNQGFIRKRNLSLSLPEQSKKIFTDLQNPSPTHIHDKYEGRYYSRKNQLLLKSGRLGKSIDPAKVIQQNMETYNTLKKEVTSATKTAIVAIPLSNEFNKHKISKLSINEIVIPCSIKFPKTNKIFKFSQNLRCKTQTWDHVFMRGKQHSKRASKKEGKLIVPYPISPKKYDELTLNEIIQNSQIDYKENLFIKIKQLRGRIERNISNSRMFHRQEEVFEGW